MKQIKIQFGNKGLFFNVSMQNTSHKVWVAMFWYGEDNELILYVSVCQDEKKQYKKSAEWNNLKSTY